MNNKEFNTNLENLKTCNVQNTNEGGSLPFGSVQSFINAVDEPAEKTLVCCFAQSLNSKVSLDERQRTNESKKKNNRGKTQTDRKNTIKVSAGLKYRWSQYLNRHANNLLLKPH